MWNTASVCLLLAQATLGGHGHRGAKVLAIEPCTTCGAETRVILAQIDILQHHPKKRKRDDAAHELRKVDWHCHPEVVSALSTALLSDCDEDVREEAAQSLAKMAPCLPEAHEALRHAAEADPDRGTRRWARKALERMARRPCQGPCQICGPSGGAVPVGPPRPVGDPIDLPEVQAPARILVPPALGPLEDLPPALAPVDPPLPATPEELPPADSGPRVPARVVSPPPADAPVAPPAEDLPLEPPLEQPRPSP